MKKILWTLLIALLLPFSVYALELPDTYSKNVLIYDLTDDEMLLEKKSDEKVNIASLTKIMTTITAIEKNSDLNKKVTVTNEMLKGIPWDASIAGLKTGETFTIEDLLYASILPSGADATQSLAITSSGSIKSFVEDMNTLAKKIGANSTHFVNVTGLDVEDHYSTASDILKILKYALDNPKFKKIFCTKSYTLSNGKTVESTIIMYNKMMNLDTSRILGSKTGYTSKAGVCISALINSSGHEIIIITLNAPYVYGNFYNLRDAVSLTNFLDKNYKNETVIQKGSLIKTLNVKLSNIDTYNIRTEEDITKFLPNDYDKEKIKIIYEGLEELNFTNKKGSKIGTAKYYYNDKLITEEEITLKSDINMNFLKIIKAYLWQTVLVIIVLFIVIKIIKKRRRRKKRKMAKNRTRS